jgi:hypothetical protein
MKKVGYAYWGYLADAKYNYKGDKISTPDGNAFYSWSIINGLQEAGYEVYQMMPNRDRPVELLTGDTIDYFQSMGFGVIEEYNPRYKAYKGMIKDMYSKVLSWKMITKDDLFKIWDKNKVNEFDYILLEWRMAIPGRNTEEAKHEVMEWQPDLFIQNCIIEYCREYNIKLIIFDLDYKITEDEIKKELVNVDYHIIELGYKWEKSRNIKGSHIEVPFDFRYINNYDINENLKGFKNNLVYIGNRYERDWCIDKYIPTEMSGVMVYGNWLESNRDSRERWPNITFGRRLQVEDMFDVYNSSICTILLAKKEYVENGFMTVRVIESVFYGTIPLFIEDYGNDIIRRYAGAFKDELTVHNKSDVIEKVMRFKNNLEERKAIIDYLRWRLDFMDVKNFINQLEEIKEV